METSSRSAMEGSSNTNIHTIVKAQIVFLLSTLTEENFERNQVEIRTLSEQHGLGIYLHFIRRLIIHSQNKLVSPSVTTAFDSTNVTFRLLVQEVQRLARDPFLAERFREGIDKGEGDIFRHFDLTRFCDRIGLRPLERLVLAASIASSLPTLSRKELGNQAVNIIRAEFENAALAFRQRPFSFDHADLTITQATKLLNNLLSASTTDSPLLDATQRQTILTAAVSKYGQETMAPIMQQLLTTMSLPPGTTLVQLLVQLGTDITSSIDITRAILSSYQLNDENPPDDAMVSDIFSSLAKLAVEGATLCDIPTLVHALSSFSNLINWAKVVETFDKPERFGVDTATLKLIIAILQNSPREIEQPAVSGFWSEWSNPLYQLRLLDALLSLPGDTFNFVSLPGRRIVTVDDVAAASPTIKSLAANVQGHTWNSLDLFQVLVRLGDSDSADVRNCVRDMLDKAVKISADLVHIGLLQVSRTRTALQSEYCQKLLAMFLGGHPNHQLVFMRIWQIEPTYLTDALRDFYQESPMNITRILDVAQDLKILDSLLDVRPFIFALDVAALASRREYLNLDKWLADNVNAHGAEFLHAVINFLDLKAQVDKACRLTDPSNETKTMALNPQTVAIFLRVLRNGSSMMNEGDVDYCIEVRNACLQIHPRLMNLAPGSDQEPGFSVVTYSAEIEAEVDGIYKQMYDEQITIDGVIQLLQRTKTSSNPRDHEIFSCMLHFLFDEYKFFQYFYPARELAMTGYLFGSIIQHQLVDYIPLGIAIRYVLDALQCPPETNLFKFGLQALSRFESRLPEWKPLCQALLDIPHLHEVRPDIIEVVQRAMASSNDQKIEGSGDLHGFSHPSALSEIRPAFTSIQPDEFSEGDIVQPLEETSDKILFIINNLAPLNFDSKVSDMQEHYEDDYSRWFSKYLVDQRISTEPNNHSLYLRFLDALGRPALEKYVLNETLVKSAALLNAEKTLQSSSERAVLKNLGAWLGQITLARDKPIKHRSLSFKDLLIEGAESNRLILAIPFVCKILESSSRSKIFKPPNPWLMAVMGLLAELYHFADLKLNLKFEIEVLCKSLDLDLDKLEMSTILRNRPLTESMTEPALPEYVPDIDALPMGGYEGPSHSLNDTQIMPIAGPVETQRIIGSHMDAILSSLVNLITISAQLSPLHNDGTFKRAVQVAVDRSVREIILPVVERSVTIAGISTRELVQKDFAMEGNEEKMRKAAHLMAQRLAGSLALVTCKDPMRSNMANHLKHYLTESGFNEQVTSDQVIQILVQDNIDVACAAIEKAAMDRAVTDVDEGFSIAYESRRRHRVQRGQQPFWDSAVVQNAFVSTLPDPLRIKPNGLQLQQIRVYDDFAVDNKRRLPNRPSSAGTYLRNDIAVPATYPSPVPETQRQPPYLTHSDAMDRFTRLVTELENILTKLPYNSLTELPPSHDVRIIVRQILFIAPESLEPSRTPLSMSQKIVQLLYKTTSQLGREIFVVLLDQLCQSFEDVAKEAITWLIYAEDERKLNVPVALTLLRSRLIDVSQQDVQLSKFLYDDPRHTLQNFTAGLIRECLTADPPVATQTQFSYSLEALNRLMQSGKATEQVVHLVEDLSGIRRGDAKSEMAQLQMHLLKYFQQWVLIYQRNSSPEKSFVAYITQLTKQGILEAKDVSPFFFRVCTESSIDHYAKCVAAGAYENAYQALDAMSRLIIYLMKYHGDAAGGDNSHAKTHYFKKIVSIIVLVVANRHEEQGSSFQQKPVFRLFSSLLNDLHNAEAQLGNAYFPMLLALSDTFSSLQPTYYPGFAFSWMTLISHRLFMPKLLFAENREGWSAFHQLLISLFRFLAPFLRASDLRIAARNFYRGTLRLLLVLLHDFPEFLSQYYFSLCDNIPPRCIQMRNIILSAYPSSVVLPDPHSRSGKPESEVGPIPPFLSDYTLAFKSEDLRTHLDQVLLNRAPVSSLTPLQDQLRLLSNSDTEESYDLSLINAIVMHIGVQSVAQAKARNGFPSFASTDSGVAILTHFATNLDAEGQHHLLSAMILHLRYPNAHTYWFSSMILHLFAESRDERFKEILTKILLERFVVHRPHPWGALYTFIELLRNPKYEFWNKEFVRAVPEVAFLLENVARSVFQS